MHSDKSDLATLAELEERVARLEQVLGSRLDLENRVTLRLEEVAAVLGVSSRKAREMIVREDIPHFYSGSMPLVPVEAIRRWADDRARTENERIVHSAGEGIRGIRARVR